MKKISRLSRFLSRNKERLSPLLIVTHDFPDPDALASAYALQHLAERRFGIRSRIVYEGIIGRNENKEMVRTLKLPVFKLRTSDWQKFTNIALVDTQPMFENNAFPKKKKAAIVIDQHPFVSKPLADFTLIDTESGATSVLLAQELLMSQIEIPTRLATALVYGILSDTMNLHKVRRPEILQTYLTLLPLSDLRALARIQHPDRSRTFFGALIKGIKNASICQSLVISHLGPVDSPDLVSQMADFLLTCGGIQWSFCTGRYHENLHASLRSVNPHARAGEILRDVFAESGQAGGHGRMAGGKMRVGEPQAEKLWRETEEMLTNRLLGRLRIRKRTQQSPLYREPRAHQKRRGKV